MFPPRQPTPPARPPPPTTSPVAGAGAADEGPWVGRPEEAEAASPLGPTPTSRKRKRKHSAGEPADDDGPMASSTCVDARSLGGSGSSGPLPRRRARVGADGPAAHGADGPAAHGADGPSAGSSPERAASTSASDDAAAFLARLLPRSPGLFAEAPTATAPATARAAALPMPPGWVGAVPSMGAARPRPPPVPPTAGAPRPAGLVAEDEIGFIWHQRAILHHLERQACALMFARPWPSILDWPAARQLLSTWNQALALVTPGGTAAGSAPLAAPAQAPFAVPTRQRLVAILAMHLGEASTFALWQQACAGLDDAAAAVLGVWAVAAVSWTGRGQDAVALVDHIAGARQATFTGHWLAMMLRRMHASSDPLLTLHLYARLVEHTDGHLFDDTLALVGCLISLQSNLYLAARIEHDYITQRLRCAPNARTVNTAQAVLRGAAAAARR